MNLNEPTDVAGPSLGISSCLLPDAQDLKFLEQWFRPGFEAEGAVAPLLGPIREYLGRPGKRVRAELVRLGFELASSVSGCGDQPKPEKLLVALSTLVELLHAGSLAIDDIQDQSPTRRGLPALHAVIGQASAINSANWLYFWPTELVRRLELEPALELEIYRLYHRTLIEAHSGQSMDLSFDMNKTPQEQVESISKATLGLKTGALMAMCCELGAVAGSADPATRARLAQLGQSFGVLLQMFNDLADFGPDQPRHQLQPLVRPSWVWAVGARALEASKFLEFQEWMSAGAPAQQEGVGRTVVAAATNEALASMTGWLADIRVAFGERPALRRLEELARKVSLAHVPTQSKK